MDETQLQILLTAKDEVSAVLQNTVKSLQNLQTALNTTKSASSTASGGIVKDLESVNNTSSTLGKGLQDLTAIFGGLGAARLEGLLGAGAIFYGLTNFVKGSIDAAEDAAKQYTQLDAVLKSTGGVSGETEASIKALTASLVDQSAYQDETILSAENMLLTFTNIGQSVFPTATKAVLDMATAMGTDLQSTAIQVGKALQDPVNGATALQRVGVRLTQSQQDLIKSLVQTGQTAQAQQVILNELNTEFGGSAAAQITSYAGQINKFNQEWTDFQQQVGTALLPILAQLLTALGSVLKWLEDNSSMIKDTVVPAVEALTAAFVAYKAAVLGAAAVTALEGVFAGISTGAGALTTVLYALAEAFETVSTAELLVIPGFGLVAAAAAAAAVVISNAANQTIDAWTAATQAQGNAAQQATKLIDQTNEHLEAAQATKNDKVIALAQAEHDKAIALAKDESAQVIAALDQQVQAAQSALQNDPTASGIWKNKISTAPDTSMASSAVDIGDDVKTAVQKAKDQYNSLGQTLGDTLAQIATDHQQKITQIKTSLASLSDQWGDALQSGAEKLDSLRTQAASSLASIKDSIKSTTQSISDLNAQYNQTSADNTSSIAQKFVDAQNNIKDLTASLAKATDAQQIVDIKTQINAQQSALNETAGFQATIADQISAAQKESSKSALQQAIDAYNGQQAAAKTAHDTQLSNLQTELAQEQTNYNQTVIDSNNKIAQAQAETAATVLKIQQEQAVQVKAYNDEQALFKTKTDAINKIIQDAEDFRTKAVNDETQETVDQINIEIGKYNDLAAAAKAAASAASGASLFGAANAFTGQTSTPSQIIFGGKASGGNVAQSGNYYLHAGEYVVPSRDVAQGGGMVVNINGGTYLSEDVAEQIGNMIMDKFKTNYRV